MIEILLAASYVLVIVNITIMPTLLPYIRHDISMSDADAALILAIFSVVAIPTNLIGGILSDRYERGMFLTVGASICSLSFLVMAMLTSAVGIVFSRALCAVGMAMVASAIFPSVGDRFPLEQRTRVTAFVMGGSSVASLIWQPLCALLGGIGCWRYFVLTLSIFASVLAFAVRWYLPKIREPSHSLNDGLVKQLLELKETAIDRRVCNTLIAYYLCSLGTSLFTAMYPTWLQDNGVSSSQAAVIFMFGGLGSLVAAVALARGPGKQATVGLVSASSCATMSISMITMSAADSAVALQSLLYTTLVAARSAYSVAAVSSLMTIVSASQRGAINGLLSVTFQSAVAIGSAGAVFLYRNDPTFGITAIGAVVLLGLTVMVQYLVQQPKGVKTPTVGTSDPATKNQVAC